MSGGSSDTTYVDTQTLRESILRDLQEARYAIARDDYVTAARWIGEASHTTKALLRRAHCKLVHGRD